MSIEGSASALANWIAPALSVLAGGLLTMLASWAADRRLSERERESRKEERKDRLAIRRNDFQRETLLALQVASQQLMRTTGASLHQDIVAHRTTGEWQKQQLPNNLSDDHLLLTTETMLLASRVRDDDVRKLADRMRAQATVVGMSSDESEAEGRMMAATDTQQALIQRIGELVRELDETD